MALFGFGYKNKLEEIRKYIEQEKYEEAAHLADRIPEQKLKSAHELNLLGKAYKCNGDFLQAKGVFERSYELRCSRTVLLDIMDCSLEINDMNAAEKYFDEYHRVAPEDKVTQYMYRYRIEKKKKRERRLLITILEELKALEYMEEFAYELAKQYHKAGMAQECMNECNDIILWFGFGPTVERAKALLAYYRGEISLEEIKSAGLRYKEEQERLRAEINAEQREAAAAKEEAVMEPQDEVQKEDAPQEKELLWENQEEPVDEVFEGIDTQESELMPETDAVTEDSQTETDREVEKSEAGFQESAEEELPELDFSDIDFDTEEELPSMPEPVAEEPDYNTRTEAELYIEEPEEENFVTQNERLAELLRKSRVSVSDVLKNFGRIERIQKQVMKSLELVVNDREKAYFVITGEKETGKTTLALHLVHLLYELGIVKYDRTATIDAVQLNQVSIQDYGEELRNCNLVIENAGGMTRESVDGLIEFSKGRKGSICVILEDTVRDINKFLRGREDLNSLFNNRIHLGKYNTDDLLGFAYDYIKKEDYSIDKLAAQILKNNINEIVRNYSNEHRLMQTLKLAKQAVMRAEERNQKLLLSMATAGKIKEGNYLVITADDVTQ